MGATEHRAEPLFAPEPLTGVSRRRARLPSSCDVAPVVAAYLSQLGGDSTVPPELAAIVRDAHLAAQPARSRETAVLVGLALVLFAAALTLALAVLPGALG